MDRIVAIGEAHMAGKLFMTRSPNLVMMRGDVEWTGAYGQKIIEGITLWLSPEEAKTLSNALLDLALHVPEIDPEDDEEAGASSQEEG